MQGKIALEEHFAVDAPDQDTSSRLAGNATWAETARRLVDFHDLRLNDMDACGIEYAILSLNAPAVQMILDGKMITIPASTLSSVDGRLVTSLSKRQVLGL